MENNKNKNHSRDHLTHPGRPPKKSYNPNQLMQELIIITVDVYHNTHEIKSTAIELDMAPAKQGEETADHRQGLSLPRDRTDPVPLGKGQNDGRDTGNHRFEQGIGRIR